MPFYHTERDEAKHWPAWWQVAGGKLQVASRKLQVPRGRSSPTCNLQLAHLQLATKSRGVLTSTFNHFIISAR